jgi:hypothetical protein
VEVRGRNLFTRVSNITVPIFTKRRPVGQFFKPYNECSEHKTDSLVADTRSHAAGRVPPCKRVFNFYLFIYFLQFAIRIGGIRPHRSE